MLDIRLLREKPEWVRERLNTRGTDFSAQLETILATDAERRRLETEVQRLSAERNKTSKEIGALRAKKADSSALETRVRAIGEEIDGLNSQLTQVDDEQRNLLLSIPNLPHESVPVGADASANPVVKTWGDKPIFSFQPKEHVELATKLGLVDFERATKLSGSGFLCFTGAGARLQRALIQFLIDLHTEHHGYREISPPYIVRRDVLVGTAQLPKFEEDQYGIRGGQLFLIPTAEVPVTNYYREEIVSSTDLPKLFVSHTPCFRQEAGAAGKETRGMIRVHQFDKVELVKITTRETSYAELETLVQDAEKVLQLLGLHYQVVALCTGDMGFGSAKTYDIEVWAPGQNRYLEVSSCSNCEDFQARRMSLRYKDAEGKNHLAHTLNGSGTALPRLYVALLETYQQPDGSIAIPEVLQGYTRFKKIEAP
jgi:seryl-tRNA synthetase